MKPTNQIVLKMVLASSVGQAMSDADRDALRQTLETTDARDVRGWLGDQIFKAARLFKGDYVGHPFRGNQHSDASGVSTGGASGGAKGGGNKSSKNLGLKVGDFQTVSRDGMDYEGTIVGIKNGVVTIETSNNSSGEDYDDPREIDIKLADISHVDGEKIEDTSPAAGKKRVAELDAKLESARQSRERSAREEGAETSSRFLNDSNEKTSSKPPMSSAGKRTVAAANRSLKSFQEVVDELDAIVASRDQIIDDLVDEEGVRRKDATQDVDDDIAVLRYAIENSKFKDSVKPEDDSAEAGRKRVQAIEAREKEIARATERGKRERASENERRKTLTPVTEDNIDKPLKGDEAKEFKSNFKDAQTAVKTTRALIAELRLKANDKAMRARLGPEGLDRVQMDLQEAQEETDRFENILNDNPKASIRSAVSISAMGTDVGETVKGLIRTSAQDMKIDIFKIDDAALQTAGDRNFGVSGDKYDVEAAFDQL